MMFWGVGNESWGCGGRMTAPEYATEFRRYSEYLRGVGDLSPFLVATGPSGADTTWMVGFLSNLGRAGRGNLGIDLHYYTRPNGAPGQQLAQGARPAGQGGPPAQLAAQRQGQGAQQLNRDATGFGEAEWFAIMRNTLRMDELIEPHSAIMDRYDPQKRIWLIVGEWGTWYNQVAGQPPGVPVPAELAA